MHAVMQPVYMSLVGVKGWLVDGVGVVEPTPEEAADAAKIGKM